MSARRAAPEAATPASSPEALSAAQVASWRERGFVLVDGLLPPGLVRRMILSTMRTNQGALCMSRKARRDMTPPWDADAG